MPPDWQSFGQLCAERQVPRWLTDEALAGQSDDAHSEFATGFNKGQPHPSLTFHWPEKPEDSWKLVVLIGRDSEEAQPVGFDFMHKTSGCLWSSHLEPVCQQFNDLQPGWADLEPEFFRKLGITVLTVDAYQSLLDTLLPNWI